MKGGVSVFVPVYNEKKIINANIRRLHDFLKKTGMRFEIIIVDDNSDDGTPRLADRIAKGNKCIRVLHYKNGPSRRENLAVSFEKSNFDICSYMDLDLATDLDEFPRLISLVGSYDIVIGSRYVKGAIIKRKLYRRMISFAYNRGIRLLFGSNINDHQCGYKAFKKDKGLEIIREMGYDHSYARGWFWDAEFLIRAQKMGIRTKEIPIRWHYGQKSTFALSRETKLIHFMLMLWWKMNRR